MYEPIPSFRIVSDNNSISIVFQPEIPYGLTAYLEPRISALFLGMKIDKQMIYHIESVIAYHLNQLVNAGRLYKFSLDDRWVFVDDAFGVMRRALE